MLLDATTTRQDHVSLSVQHTPGDRFIEAITTADKIILASNNNRSSKVVDQRLDALDRMIVQTHGNPLLNARGQAVMDIRIILYPTTPTYLSEA